MRMTSPAASRFCRCSTTVDGESPVSRESSDGIFFCFARLWSIFIRVPAETAFKVVRSSSIFDHLYYLFLFLTGSKSFRAKLEDLASGERIYSVRFLGDKAYMVTFRQTDPLFVIDLSAPENPKVLGYLKIPGVSDYLHPYDETHIIGLGRDATEEGRIRGMKLAIFDVSDFSNPKEISKYIIGEQGTYSEALSDHKAFLFSKEKNLLVIPVSEYRPIKAAGQDYWQGKYEQAAYVFNIDLTNGISLKGKITHQNATDSKNENYYDYNSQIKRSLYIDNVLYTISQKMIKMNALDNLDEINKVELPAENIEPRVYAME
ncbi:Beta propeller domain protein [uncultured archaeon]|nr:Beta propeller domain protein [uncultured archaeon]